MYKKGAAPLHISSIEGRVEEAMILIKNGAKIDALTDMDETPLMCAAEHCRLDMARLLIEHGADVGKKDTNAKTACYIGSLRGYKDMVSFLIEKGASEGDIVPPLLTAAFSGDLEAVKHPNVHIHAPALHEIGEVREVLGDARCLRGAPSAAKVGEAGGAVAGDVRSS